MFVLLFKLIKNCTINVTEKYLKIYNAVLIWLNAYSNM